MLVHDGVDEAKLFAALLSSLRATGKFPADAAAASAAAAAAAASQPTAAAPSSSRSDVQAAEYELRVAAAETRAAAAEARLAEAALQNARLAEQLAAVKLENARLGGGRGGAHVRWIKCTPEFVVMRTHLQLSKTKQKPFILARVCM